MGSALNHNTPASNIDEDVASVEEVGTKKGVIRRVGRIIRITATLARGVTKAVEYAALGGGVGVLADTLGVAEPVSGAIRDTVKKVFDTLPEVMHISTIAPSWMQEVIARTEVAQNLALLLEVGAVAGAAKFLSGVFRLMGAQRGKIEKLLAGTLQMGAAGVLGYEAASYFFQGENTDVLRGIIPFFVERGGDIPAWLGSGEMRQKLWAYVAGVLSAGIAKWAIDKNFVPLFLRRRKLS